MSINSGFPYIGVGLSYKYHYIGKIANNLKYIDCFEVKPEHYFYDTKNSVEELHILAEKLPLIAHGLFLSVGSIEGLAKSHISNLNKFFHFAPKIAWVGEHLGCTRAGGIKIPHFINIPYSGEMLNIIIRNIKVLQKQISTPMIFENIPLEFLYPESEISEPEFLKQLTKNTGCGLLFDATNMYANCHNFGWNFDDYLNQYPIENIVQVHFNGGKLTADGRYLDSHSEPTPDIVWDILKEVLKRGAPVKAMILERDDEVDLNTLAGELDKAKKLIKKYSKWQ